ncbi:MAG TPA: GTPase domain-containing protein [Mycobacteriales bacterium]|nr:GTPase domain-containing protein [Mycobacteriales bacterium]
MSPDLATAVATVRDRAAALRLGLEVPGADEARRSRHELVRQVEDYLLPRLGRLDAPLLAVVGGSTGAGKSTLVNTLVGAPVSAAGVLRPTTRSPVLLCAPGDERWFADGRILPGLARSSGPAASGNQSLQLVPHPAVPAGLALLDAPDVDSVVAGNRELAAQLLAAADLWIFVTTAARYADAVPWELLHTAQRRGTALAVVCNRVPPAGMREVMTHLGQMLREGGLSRAALFGVPEVPLTDGFIPPPAVAPLKDWLLGLAADAVARAEVVRATLDGALRSMSERVPALARAADDSSAAAAALLEDADTLYAAAVRDVDDGVRGGSVLRGEVLARWQEFVGTGELLRGLQSRVGRARDKVVSVFTGRPMGDQEVAEAVESSVESLVRAAADRAAERTAEAWRGRPGGAALLGASRSVLARSSPEFSDRLRSEVRAWQGDVLALVSSQGAQRRTAARLASFGVNGAGLTVMLLVFAQTGGLTGTEVLVAGGTSALSQKVLEAVFGDGAVRALATQAREDLIERVERLLGAEAERYRSLVVSSAPDPTAAAALRAAAADLESARRATSAVSRPAAPATPPPSPAPPRKVSWWRRVFEG